jgi:uncharacterized protein
MRLFSGQVSLIAEDILRTLQRGQAIEVLEENQAEVQLDIESVLREYIRMDRELTNRARTMVSASSGSGGSSIGRVKRKLAKEKGVQVGEDAVADVIAQLIEIFLHKDFVEEIFVEDHDFRRIVAPILKKYGETEAQLDSEVRNRIKNIEEGSASWDIEYNRVMEKMKQTKKLD